MLFHISGKRVSLIVLGLFLLVGLIMVLGFAYHITTPAKKGGNDQVFFVRQGTTLNEVARGLEREKIITSKRFLLLWARLMGYAREIKAGEYKLSSGMPPLKVLDILRKGFVITHPVTVPEGFTRRQISELLAKKPLADKKEFLSLTGNPTIAKRYGISGSGLEGYLYPDTYHFSRGLPALSVIDVMVKRFWKVVEPFKESIEQSGMTVEQLVTLASIVEKETGLAEERSIIAGVFLNRLKRGMHLASDPTVIYGLENFDGNLTRNDLSQPTAYNTYLIRGLPPGPIANPGKEAIRAVLYPAKTDYLYFVSKNDGSHYFSRTLSEHSKAVELYQKKRPTGHRKTS